RGGPRRRNNGRRAERSERSGRGCVPRPRNGVLRNRAGLSLGAGKSYVRSQSHARRSHSHRPLGPRGGFAMGMHLIAFSFTDPADWLVVLQVAIGLGMVIFIHELGHFAVAKMCG